MKDVQDVIKFIVMGLTIGFSLISYGHTTFGTKTQIMDIKVTQRYIIDLLSKRLDRIEKKIDEL